MTRINANLNVKCLTDQHLLAEHREIKRMCPHYLKRKSLNKFNDIPEFFTLNTGHMNFFLDKGKFTYERYMTIYEECRFRGLNASWYADNWKKAYSDGFHFNDWSARQIDNEKVKERIRERIINGKVVFRYYGKNISKGEAINLLNRD